MTATASAIATPTTTTTPVSAPRYGRPPDAGQLQEWVRSFHRDGYVLLPEVLPRELCERLREDFDSICPTTHQPTECAVRLFESSRANLELFDCEPIVTLAETLLGEDGNYGVETCHVVHNNSFRTSAGGGFSHWHQDDSPHFLCTDAQPPANIHLPVLLMTANFYLTDQEQAMNGPAQVVPGSHRFGQIPPADLTGTRWEPQIITCGGRAGSVMIFNSQVWHRGAPNRSNRVRYVTQVSYGRKSIAHFFSPFMGYQMQAMALDWASTPRRRRLLGYLPNGAYG